MEYAIRFLAGGVAVCAFSVLGDVLRPKSFAGLFGAAPSVAIVTLMIAIAQRGSAYALIEARSMMIGAASLWLYSIIVFRLTKKNDMPALRATGIALAGWVACAFTLKWYLRVLYG